MERSEKELLNVQEQHVHSKRQNGRLKQEPKPKIGPKLTNKKGTWVILWIFRKPLRGPLSSGCLLLGRDQGSLGLRCSSKCCCACYLPAALDNAIREQPCFRAVGKRYRT